MDAVDEWKRDQVNARPCAKRKIAVVESRRAGRRWRRQELWDKVESVALGLVLGTEVACLIGLGAYCLLQLVAP